MARSVSIKTITVIVIAITAWAGFAFGTRYNACTVALRADNSRLDTIGAEIDFRLNRLTTLLAKGPLDPADHEIDRIVHGDDLSVEGFGALENWIDPSVPVPSWNGENTPVPVRLPPEVLYRLRLSEFSDIWLQAQIIAVHLSMRNDADIGLAHAHQAILMKRMQWLAAADAASARPSLSPNRCIRRGLGMD